MQIQFCGGPDDYREIAEKVRSEVDLLMPNKFYYTYIKDGSLTGRFEVTVNYKDTPLPCTLVHSKTEQGHGYPQTNWTEFNKRLGAAIMGL